MLSTQIVRHFFVLLKVEARCKSFIFYGLITLMPGVLGQVSQNVADSLYEVGKSAVKGTVGAVTDIAHETVEQVSLSSSQAMSSDNAHIGSDEINNKENKRALEYRRFQEVQAELARYIHRRKELDAKIADEQSANIRERNKEDILKEKKHESWINNMINRSQTSTEKGRLSE